MNAPDLPPLTPPGLPQELSTDPLALDPPVPQRSVLLFGQQMGLGLSLEDTQEILNPTQTPLTPIPNTLAAVRGMLNLRGQMLLVLDLGYLLRYRYNPGLHPNRIIVIRSPATGAPDSRAPDSRAPDPLGLLVERVHYVASVPLAQIKRVPDFTSVPASGLARLSPLVMGTANWEGRYWQLLSVPALLNATQWS